MNLRIGSIIIGIILAISLLVSCDNDPVPGTSIQLSMETQEQIYAGDPVNFILDTEAEKIAIFTGDDLHVYDSLPRHTGFAVEGNLYTYEYNSMGNFKVVAVATSLGHWGEKENMKTDEIYVDVIDNRAGIKRFYMKALPDKKRYIGEIGDNQVIFNSFIGENLLTVECVLTLMSPDAKIYFNDNRDVAYSDKDEFVVDFSNDPKFIIVAPDGTEKTYTITLNND